jgi:hypothetical protein
MALIGERTVSSGKAALHFLVGIYALAIRYAI